MRWLRYETDSREHYGIIEGNEVVEVTGDPFAGYQTTRIKHKLNDVKFLVPVVPKTFYAAGLNYPSTSPKRQKLGAAEPQRLISATAPTTPSLQGEASSFRKMPANSCNDAELSRSSHQGKASLGRDASAASSAGRSATT